jgi:hypothetical protein
MFVVLFSLMLRRRFSMLCGQQMVSVCQMSMMACHFVRTCFMVLCSLPMMTGCVFVVLSGFRVMLRAFMFSHCLSSFPKLIGTHIATGSIAHSQLC